MKTFTFRFKLIFSILVFAGMHANADVRLPAIVGDGMILQRNEPLKIWGWADPGEKVSVTFMEEEHSTKTGKDGKWMVKLDPMQAGGPYSMEIEGNNKIVLKNILIGDVWICSGQSNMTHYFGRHKERYAKEIAESKNSEIRQFFVPDKPVLTGPIEDIPGQKWVEADPQSLLDFTVIGYFFAKKLYDEYRVPMGIVNTCVGGTPIEAWISEDGFREFPDIMKTVKQNQDTAYVNEVSRKFRQAMRSNWSGAARPQDKGMSGDVKWFDPAYQPLNWKQINVPGYWEDQGVRDLNGVVWYRRELTVPQNMTGVEAMVKLGRIVDADELYINGQRVGGTGYQYPQREYKIGADVLKPGKNLFVVRITNNGGKGGFVPDKPYLLLAAGDTVDLKGYWEYKVGQVNPPRKFSRDKDSEPIVWPVSPQNSPTALYNGMIAPYINYGVRGFLWYQGESNAGNPDPYAKLLTAIINDWRSHWDLGDLPFLIAQLPNFMDVNYSPEESNWAEIREAELETALHTPRTGLDINIDLGEWNDIHPGNKKPVGERLALQAMKISYGDNKVVSSGPIRKAARLDGNKVIISFDNVGSGLVSGNGEALAHFALAGEDGEYVWANAEIKNNEVVVWNDSVEHPKSVRYAWADNPDFANLYNKEGLPASPFQLAVKE